MKTLLVSINKGGVGKSMISCQLARYAQSLGLRVLFIDFDDQANSSKHLLRDQIAQPYPLTITELFCRYKDISANDKPTEFNYSNITLVQADAKLVVTVVEQSQSSSEFEGFKKGDIYLDNFDAFIEDVTPYFDLCIIDGAPTGDTRIVYAMCVANAVLSPIQLAQESIEGMSETLNGSRGILRLKKHFNETLEFLGFLPNLVKTTQAQIAMFEDIFKAYGKFMLRDDKEKPLFIPDSAAFKDVQSIGCSLATYAKTNSTARKNYGVIRPIFDVILNRLGLADQIIEAKETQKKTTEAAAKALAEKARVEQEEKEQEEEVIES